MIVTQLEKLTSVDLADQHPVIRILADEGEVVGVAAAVAKTVKQKKTNILLYINFFRC